MLVKKQRKMNTLHYWWECKSVWKLLKKLKIELPRDPAIPFQAYIQRNTSQHTIGITAPQCFQQHYSQQPIWGSSQCTHQLMNGYRKCGTYILFCHKEE
jgi:hypothetical protein